MGTHIERLLSDLESGSDDDRSVAHSCRVELEAMKRANAELRALIESAYREGYQDRAPDAWRHEAGHELVLRASWERSQARALTTTEAKK